MKNTSKLLSEANISNLVNTIFETTPAVGISIVAGSVSDIYYEQSFGVIHSSSDIKISSRTLFDIQSITKVVATTALLEKFILNQMISLNDPVIQYLPELTGYNKTDIKIIDLVLHQSGISDEDFVRDFSSASELWNEMFNTELRFSPGSSIEYTDVGYRLLGLCLERVGGNNLDQLCKRYVWSTLGMEQTTYNFSSNSSIIPKTMIAGHGDSWGLVDDAQDRLLAQPLGCDGVFSSSKDLVIFCRNMLTKLSDSDYFNNLMAVSAGQTNGTWSFYESLGIGKKIFGWEQHHKNQSYLGKKHTPYSLEKAGGAGAFICIRPEKNDFLIYLTNHGKPEPFSMESWNNLVSNLKVREIAEGILNL